MLSYIQHIWRQRILTILLCLCGALSAFGQLLNLDTEVPQRILSKESRFYLITCDPGEIIYERFGHSAIRLIDPTLFVDVTYHYGVFDYLQPHFAARFVSGATDYSIGCWPWDLFIFDYKDRHSAVYSQELDLTWDERNQLFLALEKNNEKKNRIYRYNFVFDNCATRPFNIIIKTLQYDIKTPYEQDTTKGEDIIQNIRTFRPDPDIKTHSGKKATYRNVIEEFLGSNTWWRFSIDMVLGKSADEAIGWQQLLAFPTYQKEIVEQISVVRKNGAKTEAHPLVKESRPLLDFPKTPKPNDGMRNPIAICCFVLAILTLVTWFGWRKKRYFVWIDQILFIVYGLCGCVIFFLMFFSLHPLVDHNFNLLWLNPLQLIFALLLFRKSLRKKMVPYLWFNSLTVVVAMVLWGFGPQMMHPAFLPLMVAMLIRSLYYIMYHTKQTDEK